MTVETEIYSRIKDYSGMSALIGSRVYNLEIPENDTLPAVSFQKISSVPERDFGTDAGVFSSRYQIDIIGQTLISECVAVRDLVYAALNRHRGTVIQDIFFDGEQRLPMPEEKLKRITMDFIVWHS